MRSVTRRPRGLQDRGSVSVFVAVIALAFVLMAGLAGAGGQERGA